MAFATAGPGVADRFAATVRADDVERALDVARVLPAAEIIEQMWSGCREVLAATASRVADISPGGPRSF